MPVSADLSRWGWPLLMAMAACVVGLLAGYDPRFAIAASFALAFVLVAFANLTLGLTCFAVLAAADLIPASSALLSVTKAAGLLLAVSWLALVTTRREQEADFARVYPGLSLALVAFIGWALLSATWAEDPARSVSAASRFALNIVLFLIVFTAVRNTHHARMLGGGYVLGASIAAAYGMATGSDPSAEGRLAGGGLDPNELAAVLVPGVVLGLGLAASYRDNPPARFLAIAGAAFCAGAIFLTASRGGLIALSVALLATVVLARGWRWQALVATTAVAISAFFYFLGVATPEARERISTTTQGQERILEGRTTIWAVGLRTFEDNAIAGVGGGNFGIASRHYLLEPGAVGRSDQIIQETPAAHNIYLEVGSELGVIGLGLLLSIIVFCIGAAVRAARIFESAGDKRMAIFATACAVGIIGTLAADFFISEQHSKQLWLLLGLCPALLSIARTAPGQPAP